MKVKILTTFNHEGVVYVLDDIRTVPDALGEYFCRAGWAEDDAGLVATGAPAVNETILLEVAEVAVDGTLEVING